MPKLTDYKELVETMHLILEDHGRCSTSTMQHDLQCRIGYKNAGRVKFMLSLLEETQQVKKRGNKWYFVKPEDRGVNSTGSSDPSGWDEAEFRRRFDREVQKTEAAEAVANLKQDTIDSLRKNVSDLESDMADVRAEAKNMAGQVHTVQIKNGKRVLRKVKAAFHTKFAKLLFFAQKRMNTFIYGPTGCGKTFICEQLASCLVFTVDSGDYKVGDPLPFYSISCTSGMSEGKLEGRRLPGKGGDFEYTISEFVKCFENGGVFLLDELDACDPNVLMIINSALSNGYMTLANRSENPVAHRHQDCVVLATANTLGTGADRQYSGRNKLDGATMDRFSVAKVKLDYDPNVEAQLIHLKPLLKLCLKIRKAIVEHGLERAMSTRTMLDSQKSIVDGLPNAYVEIFGGRDDGFFSGWREDEHQQILAKVPELHRLAEYDGGATEETSETEATSEATETTNFEMPELIGSAKQIKWAKNLRKDWFKKGSKTCEYVVSRNPECKFWIDNRFNMNAIFQTTKTALGFDS